MSKPKRILVLAFPDCQMLDVTGPLQMLAGVNDELGRQAYELVIAAPKRGPFKTSSGVSLVADLAIADVRSKYRASASLMVVGVTAARAWHHGRCSQRLPMEPPDVATFSF